MKTTIKLILYYFIYQLLFGGALMGLAQVWPMGVTTQLAWGLLLSGVAMGVHLVAGGHVNLRKALRPVKPTPMLCSIVCILSAIVGSNALNALLTLPDWLEADFGALSRNALGIASVVVIAPVVEELLFRGAIIRHLRNQGYTPWKSIAVSALLFGLIHVNPAQVPFAALMGLVLGWVAVSTRSLLSAIIGHMLNNALGVIEIMNTGSGSAVPSYESLSTYELIMVASVGLTTSFLTGRKLTHLLEMDE